MFCAIDYGMFAEIKRSGSFLPSICRILDSKKITKELYIHGSRIEKEQDVLKNGIPINRASYDEIQKVCEKFDIDITDYLGDVVPD